MRVDVSVPIRAPVSRVWSLITDIERAADTISGIDKVEVLEKPQQGLTGLKWKETRTMLGKPATETMWITDVEDGRSYVTEARSHGSIYRTRIQVDETATGSRLRMTFSAEPTSLGARIVSGAFGLLMKRSIRSALQKDLEDVKRAAESRHVEEAGR